MSTLQENGGKLSRAVTRMVGRARWQYYKCYHYLADDDDDDDDGDDDEDDDDVVQTEKRIGYLRATYLRQLLPRPSHLVSWVPEP